MMMSWLWKRKDKDRILAAINIYKYIKVLSSKKRNYPYFLYLHMVLSERVGVLFFWVKTDDL